MRVSKTHFGELAGGREVYLFGFACKNGLIVKITNYGGIITSIQMPGRDGRKEELTTGFDSLEPYLGDHPNFGVIVGRFANRIANGRFAIDGKEYHLPVNNGPNHLHGGPDGFHSQLWGYTLDTQNDRAVLKLSLTSPHMDAGYPGRLETQVTYTVFDDNRLRMDFHATTDQATHVNLTGHAYFNLGGFSETIEGHQLMLNAHQYLELDDVQIPTGRKRNCRGTAFDFRKPARLSDNRVPHAYEMDHCFVLDEDRGPGTAAAMLCHEASGRRLKVFTTQPGIQVYTSNFLDGSISGHNGISYQKHHAICLETQHFPDAPNQPAFPSTLLRPGETYQHSIQYVFDLC